jgi:putative endonuclease
MHFVYIIHSPRFDKYYVGETSMVQGRIEQHITGKYKSASTFFTNDWELHLEIELDSRTEALVIEKYIKSMKSKKFIQRLVTEKEFLIQFKTVVKERFSIDIK